MRYQQWFSFQIEHDFFPEKTCTTFKLAPLAYTQHIFKNYNIKLQQQGNDYQLYTKVPKSSTVWDTLSQLEDVFIQLINTDENFYNYTEAEAPFNSKTLDYITNTKANNSKLQETAVNAKTNPIEVFALQFNVDTTTVSKVEIKDHLGTSILQKDTSTLSTTPVRINATNAGIYQLWLDGTLNKTFLASPYPLHEHCYGILHIQPKLVLESLKENTCPKLKLYFEARATFWKYIIVVSEAKKINIKTLQIDNTLYDTYKQELVLGNKQGYTITSKQPLKLIKQPKTYSNLNVEYTNQFSDAVVELDVKLPVPSVKSISKITKNEKSAYCSKTIIYV